MLQKHLGIVLNQTKYNDKAFIVYLYTEAAGRMSVLVPIPKSKKSNLKSALFQPLSILEFEIDHHANQELHRLRDAKVNAVFHTIPYDPMKTAVAFFLAEFLYRTLKVEEQDEPLFFYLLHSIQWFDECETTYANFHLVFLMRFSRFLGLYPNTEHFSKGMFFDMLNACFVEHPPVHGQFLAAEDAEKMLSLMRMNYESMHLFRLSRTERNRILTIIMHYYRLHIPEMPELKSFTVLQEIFNTL